MKYKLWTIQDARCMEDLKLNGELTCDSNFGGDWIYSYDWMKSQLVQRIGSPSSSNNFPIWSWYQYDSIDHKRPDLRRGGHLPKGVEGVRIEFEKEASEVLLSDFILWHHVLNNWYLPKNESDDNNFQKLLKKYKNKYTGGLYPDVIQSALELSWENVFDFNLCDPYISTHHAQKRIQATLWKINEKEILRIDPFVAR